jgi:hypothetical protein
MKFEPSFAIVSDSIFNKISFDVAEKELIFFPSSESPDSKLLFIKMYL